MRFLALLVLCGLATILRADTSSALCERAAERYVIKYYSERRFGELKVKPTTVSVAGAVTTEIIPAQRYKTAGQVHLNYAGSTGGDSKEVKRFEVTLESNATGLTLMEFKEIRDQR